MLVIYLIGICLLVAAAVILDIRAISTINEMKASITMNDAVAIHEDAVIKSLEVEIAAGIATNHSVDTANKALEEAIENRLAALEHTTGK